jgi:hypothetical protein
VVELSFPAHEIVGEVSWLAGPAWEPVLASGVVAVPDDAVVSLDVARIESVHRSSAGLEVGYSNEPLDLGFVCNLPVDSITSLKINYWIVPESFPSVRHLAPGLRELYLAATDLDDGALAVVAELQSLKSLQMYGNRFTDAGIQQLTALKELKELYVEESTLSPSAFAFASHLPKLAQLAGLSEASMTVADIDQVKAMLPGVNVA